MDNGSFRDPPGRDAINRIASRLDIGSMQASRVRRLNGGIDNSIHLLTLQSSSGENQVVLRTFSNLSKLSATEKADREWQVLNLLAQKDVAAPRPLVNDSGGDLTGHPALVLSFLPGRPEFRPADPERWAAAFAGPLHDLHSRTRRIEPLPFLHRSADRWRRAVSAGRLASKTAGLPDSAAFATAVQDEYSRLREADATIVHTDYFPANIIWNEGAIAGIIDWAGTEIGDPAYDVAYMRMDMWLQGRPREADVFLEEYERRDGKPLANRRFAELMACMDALPDPAEWLPGWNSHGLSLTEQEVRHNLTAFIDSVLAS